MNRLAFVSRNAWEVYAAPAERSAIHTLAAKYMDFLTRCKTERETIHYVRQRLEAAGYVENGRGAKTFRVLQDKALFVARRGKQPLEQGIRLIAAHVDAPRLDLKQRPLQEQANVGQLKTHYYGGIRKYQWLARPLALHGVVVRANGERISVVLGEKEDEPVFSISDLLPHLAAQQAELVLSKAFEGEKLNLVAGNQPAAVGKKKGETPDSPVKTHLLQLLHDRYGIVEEDLYSAELQAVPAGAAREVGLDASIVGGYGHDDRVCVFCALEALLSAAATPWRTQALIFWDKEEIGSEGSTGAKSRFLEYCIQDSIDAWEPKAQFSRVMLQSRALSADVHGAVDPDWQDLHEKLNAALMGHGPCFCKFTGSRGKYCANDAHAEYVAWLRQVMHAANIPWQMAELGKVDGGGGGTVAMHLAEYGMHIIDFGPAVLSMHSPFELVSKVDVYATRLAYAAFLDAR